MFAKRATNNETFAKSISKFTNVQDDQFTLQNGRSQKIQELFDSFHSFTFFSSFYQGVNFFYPSKENI
jgi:hypothetical protein